MAESTYLLQELNQHLLAAQQLVERLERLGWSASEPKAPAAMAESRRNPRHFRPTGHLSDEGIAFIGRLFDDGATIQEAAEAMGISFRGAAKRRAAWLKMRGN